MRSRRSGVIVPDESVAVVGTSPGLKDQPLPDERDEPLRPVASELREVLTFLGLEPVLTSGT